MITESSAPGTPAGIQVEATPKSKGAAAKGAQPTKRYSVATADPSKKEANNTPTMNNRKRVIIFPLSLCTSAIDSQRLALSDLAWGPAKGGEVGEVCV